MSSTRSITSGTRRSGKLDLAAVKDPSSSYYTVQDVQRERHADADHLRGIRRHDGGRTARTIFLCYGDSNFPGQVTETRRKSELDASAAIPARRRRDTADAHDDDLQPYDSDGAPLASHSGHRGPRSRERDRTSTAYTYDDGLLVQRKGQLDADRRPARRAATT